jgi:hypothetical protein
MHISSHSIGYWKTNALAAVNLEAMRRRIEQTLFYLSSSKNKQIQTVEGFISIL